MQTGFARTGDLFACDHEGVVPDLIVTAKGIAGGLPLSAVTGRAEIMDAAHAGGLGGTYGGNPLACAAALAAIETIEADGLLERARHIERLMKDRLHLLAGRRRPHRRRPRPGRHDRGRARPGRAPPSPTRSSPGRSPRAAHQQGVIVLTCGTYGNVLRFLPPLTISDALLTDGLDVLATALEETR